MGYEDFKDLTRRATSDKILRDKAFNIAENSKYDGYKKGLASVIYKFFDKKLLIAVLKMRTFQTKSQLKNYKDQLLGNSRNEKHSQFSWTIFGVLIS